MTSDSDFADCYDGSWKLNALVTKVDTLFEQIQQDLKKVASILKAKERRNQSENVNDTDSLSTENESLSSNQSNNLFSTLRDYQTIGIEWLCSLHIHNLNGIIADEMGLGKTVQVIAFFLLLFERFEKRGPHLVVAPLSVLSGWEMEIARFGGDDIFVYTHYGEKSERENGIRSYYKYIRECFRGQRTFHWKSTIILTTYEVLIKDVSLFKVLTNGKYAIEYLVVDEAHRLKNRESIIYQCLTQLSIERRILLTGTPLQNNIYELWALLSFIFPSFFHGEEEWYDWFNRPFESDEETEKPSEIQVIDVDNNDHNPTSKLPKPPRSVFQRLKPRINQEYTPMQCKNEKEMKLIIGFLHRIIKPFVLRRTRNEVSLHLPTKVEKIIYCPMSSLQIHLHKLLRHLVDTNHNNNAQPIQNTGKRLTKEVLQLLDASNSFGYGQQHHYDQQLTSSSSSTISLSLNNILMKLRKICNHPYLLLEDMKSISDELYHEYVVSSSGKLMVLHGLLQTLLSQQHKILIFSQFTSMLNIIEGYLLSHMNNMICYRLDGNTSHEQRELQIQSFQKKNATDNDTTAQIFLLSTRAGSVGLNLQIADTVILFDSDWNPQQDLQALSRVYRIGQLNNVLILRLVSTGPDEHAYSVDEYMLRNAGRKLEAGKQILANGLFSYQQQQQEGQQPLSTSLSQLFDKREEDDDANDNNGVDDDDKEDTVHDNSHSSSLKPQQSSSLLKKKRNHPKPLCYCEETLQFICQRDHNNHMNPSSSASDKDKDDAIQIVKVYFPSSSSSSSATATHPPAKQTTSVKDEELLVWKEWFDIINPLAGEMEKKEEESSSALSLLSKRKGKNRQQKKNQEIIVMVDSSEGEREGKEAVEGDGDGNLKIKHSYTPIHDSDYLEEENNDNNDLQESDSDDMFFPSNKKSKPNSSFTNFTSITRSTSLGGGFRSKRKKSKFYKQDAKKSSSARNSLKKEMEEEEKKDEDEVEVEVEQFEEDDICVLCNQPWITPQDYSSISLFHDTSSQEVENVHEFLDVMILCDDCEGSYHMACVGLTVVPEESWYCNICSREKALC